jgi:hypothetical protein
LDLSAALGAAKEKKNKRCELFREVKVKMEPNLLD